MKNMVITGCNRGLGYGINKVFNQNGYSVIGLNKTPSKDDIPEYKAPPLPKEYWEKEEKILVQMRKNSEKEKNMLKMSHERMQQRFDI